VGKDTTDLKPADAFDYAVKQVRAARDGGFDGIFAAHHYALGTGENMFQPLPLLARLAAEAPEMTMGTAIYPRGSAELRWRMEQPRWWKMLPPPISGWTTIRQQYLRSCHSLATMV